MFDLKLSVLHSLCVEVELVSSVLDQEVWEVLYGSYRFTIVSKLILQYKAYLSIKYRDLVIPEILIDSSLKLRVKLDSVDLRLCRIVLVFFRSEHSHIIENK